MKAELVVFEKKHKWSVGDKVITKLTGEGLIVNNIIYDLGASNFLYICRTAIHSSVSLYEYELIPPNK